MKIKLIKILSILFVTSLFFASSANYTYGKYVCSENKTGIGYFAWGIFDWFNSKPTYTANTEFWFSNDNGETYTRDIKEFRVGEQVNMQVRMCVTSDKKNVTQVKGKLIINNENEIAVMYTSGPVIQPEYDILTNRISYEFNLNVFKEAKPVILQYVIKSSKECDALFEVIYDDSVDESYDFRSMMHFSN